MTKSEFQQAHGEDWAKIAASPAFRAALMVCGAERLREIENLTPEQIESNGRVHLASFQGHLKTESILLDLAVESIGGFDVPEATYESDESIFCATEQPATIKRRKQK